MQGLSNPYKNYQLISLDFLDGIYIGKHLQYCKRFKFFTLIYNVTTLLICSIKTKMSNNNHKRNSENVIHNIKEP